ncbi:MAG: PLDc N-terminal domain-containing protein [Monoglobus pectinilyticus]|uniref:PLDc N-terminal domain-containing protein n=1 Tax=Monoglobus pectinilyticus TaxID=1981510 RepID=UPI0039A33629
MMTRFFKIIYSNKLFCLLMMIAQLSVLLLLSAWLGDYSKYFYTFMNFLSAVLIIYEINREEEPGFKLTWVMLIAIIPIFGTLLIYFCIITEPQKIGSQTK